MATEEPELMQKIVSLCKRRGFVFQSSEIYGGLRSAYDYGPMGVELKRNLMNEWWTAMVHSREDIYGLDASIVMHPEVWRSSGHLANFTDPLVDCQVCQERFRADKAPRKAAGEDAPIELADKGRAKAALEKLSEQLADQGIELERKGKVLHGAKAGDRGYVCSNCGSPFLSAERDFNGMFRTSLGAVDPLAGVIAAVQAGVERGDDPKALRAAVDAVISESAVYLRPETAQGMFVQFLNIQQSMAAKVPFGIAQMGKSFRNEVTVEHFIFRSCEFEQMEMEYFVEPGKGREALAYWKDQRMKWWQSIGLSPEKLTFREHDPTELAHYSDGTFDIEYQFPWGWDELEGIASRTNYDLSAHAKGSGKKLVYHDAEAIDPETGKKGWRYVPHVVEPAAGATRGVLAVLCNAYAEEPGDEEGKGARTVLRLHPRLAPIKCAILPLVRKDGMDDTARKVADEFFKQGVSAKLDMQHAIGRRYARHDEIGTPYCLTIDGQTAEDETVTIRYRDDRRQDRIKIAAAVDVVREALREGRE
ncbi:Glycyl-tRNA synthetase [Enhygromyxa salina]|uniref:Glycyl-tRNA synthetase n=1 Tax=Enhygromyxa salina TaxID=215803 RepID=A0A0C1ZCK9_9BACT|nr:glycine--tRNA ligase [Enhygromyxa salina]KIG15439.1 Glycyl-tRNA synthetase [Enhygromyxa salina]